MGVRKVFSGGKEVKEYTLLATLSAVLTVFIDLGLLRTRVLLRPLFWIFLAVMYCFKTVVNGYLTARPIVTYGDEFYLGVRLFTIPVEDYVYGFSLMTLTVVFWEYFKQKQMKRENSEAI